MTYQVSNPVNFYTGGDTTAQALGKHIAEFARIYEILNSMSTGGATIVTSSDTVLKAGEIGFDQDPGVLKVGDGVTAWGLLTGIRVMEVVDDLLSDSPEKALSAAQGKALKELIDAIPVVEIVDNLTVGGATKALSAEQGKTLKALVDTLETPVPGPPGPRGVEWRGAWDVATEYQKGDAVSHLGSSYIALKPSTGELPTNTEFWDTLSAKGSDGSGTGDMMKAVYDPDGDGKVSSAVLADTANAVAWDNVTGKPEKFQTDVVDALDSDRTDAALSAAQGKVLKAFVDGVPQVEIVDDLTSGGTDKALSAEQGKTLRSSVDSKAKALHQHTLSEVTGLSTALGAKADLVNGKVPESQLPNNNTQSPLIPTTDTFQKFIKTTNISNQTLPAGGTWLYFYWLADSQNTSDQRDIVVGVGAGGSGLPSPLMSHTTGTVFGFLWKIQ